MNSKALELGLESTSFADPSGLRPENVSSAIDLSQLITYAADEKISATVAPIMRMAEYKVATSRRTVNIRNTNRLVVDGDVEVMGGKTGFISKAGHCLATLLRLPQSEPDRRRRRPRRELEPRPLLGDPAPVQLALDEHDWSLREGPAAPAARAVARARYLNPF